MKVPAQFFSDIYASLIPTPNTNTPPSSDESLYPSPEPDSSQLNDSATIYTNLDTLETPSPILPDLLQFNYTSFTTDTFEDSQHCSPYVYPTQNEDFVPNRNGISEFDAKCGKLPSMTFPNRVNKTWTLSSSELALYPTGDHLTASLLDHHINQLSSDFQKVCYNCGTNVSSLWTPDANGNHMCNACCCYRKINHTTHRPYVKPQRTFTSKRIGRKCFNCRAEKTSLWRRNNAGEHVCNSCGLYFKMHGYNRPLSMKKETIQTRKRKQKNANDNKHQPIPMANPANQYDAYYVCDPTSASSDVLPSYSSTFVDFPSPPLTTNPTPPYYPSNNATTWIETPISIDNTCNDLGLTLL